MLPDDPQKMETFKIFSSDIERMRTGGTGAYAILDDKRTAYFNKTTYPDSIAGVEGIRERHVDAMTILKELQASSPKLKVVAPYLIGYNKTSFGESGPSRTMVLMDATGSMHSLLTKCKQRVHDMFARAQTILEDAGVGATVELQFVCFRNYANCDHDGTKSGHGLLLQKSQWQSDSNDLQTFMGSIRASGGTHWEEAVEVALQHANTEAERIKSDTPLTQVILIGDAAPNTRSQVSAGRSRYGESYWQQSKEFAKSTYWETEVDKLQQIRYLYTRLMSLKTAARVLEIFQNEQMASINSLMSTAKLKVQKL
jgi:hypothetical protein